MPKSGVLDLNEKSTGNYHGTWQDVAVTMGDSAYKDAHKAPVQAGRKGKHVWDIFGERNLVSCDEVWPKGIDCPPK
jgi:hypothetical protein